MLAFSLQRLAWCGLLPETGAFLVGSFCQGYVRVRLKTLPSSLNAKVVFLISKHQVERRTSVPVWAIATITSISVALSLILIGSILAFNIIVSLTVACLYLSYLIAISLILYRRCTGGVSYASDSPAMVTNTVGTRLVWGPWHFRGALGIFINFCACLYLILILFFSFWPIYVPIAAADMNYSSVLMVGVVVFSIFYYVVFARKHYKGPIVETETPNSGATRDSS